MNMNKTMESKWLTAEDAEDGDLVLTMKRVVEEEIGMGDDKKEKYVVYFKETEKGLVLNKTNTKTIIGLHGAESDDWKGKKIALFATEVQYQANMVLALRIRLKAPKADPAAAKDKEEEDPFEDE